MSQIVDRGRPSTRSATLSLPLIITGINEHAPVFTLVEYTFYMDEKEEITFIIGKVTANDADDSSTSDGIFVYTIAGTSTLPFTLEPTTG
ncbi:hypothetical protein LOD99_15954 [Oopsacas minuta]|uniref:Cadherin domain-containing protein n=1 Tax=Oopsacas minuta TaxID=111878 RepID=A0AAV7K7Q2_9METZ|nr:hypothetical protein LOD99_15954 [Oopsacas minuta]